MLDIRFRIPYHIDRVEQALQWVGRVNGSEMVYELIPDNDRHYWSLSLSVPCDSTVELIYGYRVVQGESIIRVEPPIVPHSLRLSLAEGETSGKIAIDDRWIDPDPEHRMGDAPLAKLLGRTDFSLLRIPSFDTATGDVFLIRSRREYEGDLLVVGADPSIGAWCPNKGLSLSLSRNGYLLQFPKRIATEYKLVWRLPSGEVHWEQGENRHYQPDDDGIFTFGYLDLPQFEGQVFIRRQLTGTAVPLFSLRGKRTQGIGDFTSAIELLDWMKEEGQSVLQLLPIYDTTFSRTERDSYPYNAITTYGIHPIYLDLWELPGFAEAPEKESWLREAQKLERHAQVAFEKVLRFKERVVECLFSRWDKQPKSEQFNQFWLDEQEQLLPYALFCAIRDMLPHKGVEDYPSYADVRRGWEKDRCYLGKSLEEAVMRCVFTQYYLYGQLGQLTEEAHKRGILIKGDLPIGVARNSVDVWTQPHLFHLDLEAGSPPDAFSPTGQDWGFPTYNWVEMEREGFAWWRRRLRSMSRHFDALRIDHILGFFRIWSIPAGTGDASLGWYVPALGFSADEVQGVTDFCNQDEHGHYHPLMMPQQRIDYERLTDEQQYKIAQRSDEYYHHRNEYLWRETALKRLTNIMTTSDILLCAEDLGVLPKSIQEVLSSLELLSLEVLRMPKLPGKRFVEPQDIPWLSVLTTGTHDMPSLRAWWAMISEEERWQLAELYHFTEDVSPRGLVEALLREARALLLILPLQDWFVRSGYGAEVDPAEEQINKPEDPHHIWNYRVPLSH